MTTARWFAWVLLGGLLLSLLGVVGFNGLMDPFDLFGSPRIEGINQNKVYGDVRMTKAYRIRRGEYDAVILGTSRGEVGLDSTHAAWEGLNAYNLSMPGATLYEITRNLQHAQAATPLKRVLLGLDFFTFSIDHETPVTFAESRLLVAADGTPQPAGQFWRDAVNVLFSEDGIEKSRETWRTNRKGRPPTHTERGRINPVRWFQGIKRKGGFRASFRAFEESYMEKGGSWFNPPTFRFRFADPKTGQSQWDRYEKLLTFCHRHDIELVLFISPIHARLQTGLWVTGLWPTFETWKRQLQRRNEQVAARFDRKPFVLVDFATVNDYTTDPVPRGETRRTVRRDGMHWYWDSAHYRAELGHVVQDRLQHPRTIADGFGRVLADVEWPAYFREQRRGLAGYHRRFPREWVELVNTAREARTLVRIAPPSG